MKCQEIIEQIERLAPKSLAEEWDNVGLLVGSFNSELKGIYLALDVTIENVQEAIDKNCNLIIAHHPIIFRPMKNLRTDLPQGKLLAKIIQNNISIYAAHTNLDIAKGGVNDVLAKKIGLQNLSPLVITTHEKLFKLVTFVPKKHLAKVRDAITSLGAGYIGNYSHCTFNIEGTGTFKPQQGTHPFIGTIGHIEKVDEIRLETIIEEKNMRKILNALEKTHPYEEIAYDIYPLVNIGKAQSLGRIGKFSSAVTLDELAEKILQNLPATYLRLVKANDKKIKTLAICSGSGGEYIEKAKFQGADAYLTADIKYHDAQKAKDIGLSLIDAGHFPTEYPIVHALKKYLQDYLTQKKIQIPIITDEISEDVFQVRIAKNKN